jgi:DNA-binding transcriptional LysR family regulator
MKLSHLGLTAFYECARTLNVTEAARQLGLTQSALSQRLAQLEDEVSSTLFIRDSKGLILTETGERLLRFAEMNAGLEEELLRDLKGTKGELAGNLRIAGFSSVLRSMIIPALAPFLRKHPGIHLSFQSHEMSELPHVLSSSRADYIITDYEMNKRGISQDILGYEEYVVIESVKHTSADDIYLDHGPQDNATESFLSAQGKIPPYRRSFMGDVYGIIEGVEEGLGRAVMSRHLIEDNRKVKILRGFKSYKRPITLHYYERPFETEVSRRVREELKKSI